MAVRYLILGVAGLVIALVGILRVLYPVVAVGVILIFAAFFWFARTNQSTPAPGKDDQSVPGR